VTGEGHEIDPQLLHINRGVGHQLGGVDDDEGAVVAGDSGNVGHGRHGPGHVRHPGEGDDLDAFVEEFRKAVGVEPVIVCHREVDELSTGSAGDHLPRDHVGVMFHRRQQDLVTDAQMIHAPPEGDGVQRRRSSSGEDNLRAGGCVDEPRYLAARFFIGGCGFLGEKVRPPMDIGVVGSVDSIHHVQDRGWFLTRGGRVEEHQGLAVNPALEYREIRPQVREVDHSAGAFTPGRRSGRIRSLPLPAEQPVRGLRR